MLRYLILGFFLMSVAVVAYVGCGPRAAVAGKKILAQIDGVLNKLDVQLETVEQAHAKLTKETEGLREKRIEADFEVKSLNEKRELLEQKLVSYKSDLARLQGLIAKGSESGTVDINGTEKPVSELKAFAQSTVKKYKATKNELITRNKTLSDAWSKNLAVLKSNEQISKQQLKKLDDQIEEIKAKKSALDAMKEASTIAGSEASISDKFNDLTKDVDGLLKEVDVKMASEAEKVEERMADSDSELSLDEYLGVESATDDSLNADIDAILGEGN